MERKRRRFSYGSIILIVCGLVALTGFFTTKVQKASADTPAFVRIIHASPYVGTADVFLDGQPLLTSFAFSSLNFFSVSRIN